MGCHTWFYKRLNPQPTYEEVKDNVLDNINRNIVLYQQMIDDTLDADTKEAYPEWDKEMGLKYIAIYNRKKRMVEKGLCKYAVCNKYEYESYVYRTSFIDGVFYVSGGDDLPHDVFRIWNYPTDKLFSFEETMEFINRNQDKVKTYEDTEERLRKFWDENPDGMINF